MQSLCIAFQTRIFIMVQLLQAFLPAIFQAINLTFYIVIIISKTNALPNIYLMISTWENTVHPMICFICVRPLRESFLEYIKRFFYPKKFGEKIYPKNSTTQISTFYPTQSSLKTIVYAKNVVSTPHR